MDKDQARFILRSFRPDGADAEDPDFAEALKLATENRELGEWLASERAFDASFADALGTVNLPASLREDIMGCLVAERGDYPQAVDADDAAWIGALASIQPPPALRDQVLAAMDRTALLEIPEVRRISRFRRAAIPLAAAAGIALAFLITRPPPAIARLPALPIEAVQAGFVRTLESASFDLEGKLEKPDAMMVLLRGKGLPCPNCPPCPGCLPRALLGLEGIGCRELVINGKQGSLLCFRTGNDSIVHLVIFRRDDVQGKFPAKANAIFTQEGRWSSARWQNDGNVYLMLGSCKVGKLETLF